MNNDQGTRCNRVIIFDSIRIPKGILDISAIMNHQMTPRSNRPRGLVIKHILQFALFAAFSLWLLYQIRQPNNDTVPLGRHLSTDRVSNFLGRKGNSGISKSTPISLSGLTLEDVTNPGEEGEIAARYSKGIEEVEFRSKTGSLKEGNDGNTLVLTVAKSNISFPDENGIPRHIREKFGGTRGGIQSVIATDGGMERNGTLQES
ncbi:hypothetical protein L2E82_39336 [Cichorium intybus]|uniref:Uncharacterized protein n=1 Tax=Cichorium intybus TaxID=13427 RepID=A0ACB9AMB6_CICIN|nr:hypothetical protein L2E82_39336 [Cichorium intybus]